MQSNGSVNQRNLERICVFANRLPRGHFPLLLSTIRFTWFRNPFGGSVWTVRHLSHRKVDKMTYEPYIAGIQDLLTKVNASKGLDLKYKPCDGDYSIGGIDNAPSVSCKLNRTSGEDRIMSLTVTLFDGFEQLPLPNGDMPLTSKAKEQIVVAIEKFWSDGNGERHVSVVVPQPPFNMVTEGNYR